jgi:hypothetical protein
MKLKEETRAHRDCRASGEKKFLSAKTKTLLRLNSQWEASFYNVHNDKTSFSATLFVFAKQWVRKVKPICKHHDK